MSDTPETDAALYPMDQVDIVWPEFARKLERERDEARVTIEDAKRALNATDHEGVLLAALRVKEERDEEREDAAQLADRLSGLELRTTEELARLEQKRDEWQKCAEQLASIIGAPDKCTWATDDEINEAWSVFAKLKEGAK